MTWTTHRVKANVPLKVEVKYLDYAVSKFEDGKDKLRIRGRINGDDDQQIFVPLFLENTLGELGIVQRVVDENGDDAPGKFGAPCTYEVLDAGPVEVLKAELDNGDIRWQIGGLDGPKSPSRERATPRAAAPPSATPAPSTGVTAEGVEAEFLQCYDSAMEIHNQAELDLTPDSVYKLAFTIHQERKRLGISYQTTTGEPFVEE